MKSLRRPRCAPVLLLDGDRAGAGRRSPARVTVSVIIVNWNAGQALEACLASLAAGGVPAPEVVLVDNASSDGSARAASARHPQVRLVETGANLGFAAGANRGAEAARGDVLVFLNPDARVLPGALATLVDALARTPGAGIAGGGLPGARGRRRPAAARGGPGALRVFRAAAACKFGLKTALAAALGRRAAAATYGRVVRACLTFAPDAS